MSDYEFHIDRLDITDRIHFAVNVYNIRIVKASYNMDYGFDLTDMSEKFVSQSLASGGALDQSCNITEFYCCIDSSFGFINPGKCTYTLIRNSYDTHIRLDRAERIIGGLCASFGNRVEKRAFAYIRQTYDS